MSHLDAYLDPCAAYGWSGTPRFSTNIVPLANGDEHRNADWAEARHEFVAPFQNISVEMVRAIRRMFYVCRGMAYAFRLVDEFDHDATDEAFGTGDGVETEFQLKKISTVDSVEYERNVYALPSAPVIKVAGVTSGTATVNLRTGVVTFSVAPANGAALTWTGSFDLWVRFATDTIPFSLDNRNAANGEVSLIEVPPPAA